MSGKSGWGSDGDGPRPAEQHGVAAETGAAIRHEHSGGILMMASPSPGQVDHTGLMHLRPVHTTDCHRRSMEGGDRKVGAAFSLNSGPGSGKPGRPRRQGPAFSRPAFRLQAFRGPVFSLPPSAVPPRRSGWHREESRHRRHGSHSRGRVESPACACHPPSCPPRPHPIPGSPGHLRGGS